MSHRFAFGPVGLLVVCMLFASREVVRAQASPAASTSAAESEEKARAHFRLGRAYYENGDFAQAAAEFESAYKISQRAQLLYNIYLAYRDANDTRHSAEALRQYLQLEKDVENRGQLEARLAALDRSLAEEPSKPAPTAASTPVGAAPGAAQTQASAAQNGTTLAPATPPPTAASSDIGPSQSMAGTGTIPADSRPSPDHTLPIVLMASGGALVVGSVVTGLIVLGKRSDLAAAETQCKKLGTCNMLPASRVADLDSKRSSGQTLAVVTDILLFGGLAVAATGAALFLLSPGRDDAPPEAQRASLSFACRPGACAGRLDLAF